MIAKEQTGEIVMYQPDDSISIEVMVQDETVWLTQQQMSRLFGTTRNNITLHVNNIFREGELQKMSVCKESLLTAADGKRYRTKFYNLDVIISVGYRVKSHVGTRFRQWASTVLKDYLLRGYASHQESLALQQVHQRIDNQNDRLVRIETTLEQQQQQLDFVVRTNEQPTELIIPTGCVWDAYAFVCDLVRSAEHRIILIDNFVDERTLLILDKRTEGVSAEVHTRFSEQTLLDFEKHNRQCAKIDYVQLPHQVHDRYLIIDDVVWLLGSSVKDMGHGLCTIIKTGFAPETIMELLRQQMPTKDRYGI